MEIADWIVFASCVGLVWLMPRLDASIFVWVEQKFIRLAGYRVLSIAVVGVVTILARMALLPWLPVQPAEIHDEYSYLLAADTFLHGRLTNPPHPLWIFFDTFHVLQHPTYASLYPPAQGAVLAIGKLLGHPSIGVLMSTAAMCAALTWMLQGWMPGKWALLGGALVFLRYGIFSYWMNSYWGGSIPATGAAMVLGAYPRILKNCRAGHLLVFGLGAAILANSRPLEGFIFCLPVVTALLWRCIRPKTLTQKTSARPIFLAIVLTFVCVAGFIAYYNWRVTKSPIVFPYFVEQREYITTPVFLWQQAKPPLHYANRQFEAFYNKTLRAESSPVSWNEKKQNMWGNAYSFWLFFLGPALSIPLLMLPWLVRDSKMRLPLIQFGLSSIGLLAVVWFWPHYAAPLLATLILLVMQAFRHLRTWRHGRRQFGLGLVRLIVIFNVLIGPVYFLNSRLPVSFKSWVRPSEALRPLYALALIPPLLALLFLWWRNNGLARSPGQGTSRFGFWGFSFLLLAVFLICAEQRIVHVSNFPFDAIELRFTRAWAEQRFASLPGNHLVLVKYSPDHNVDQEYVYNDADIDHSKTVWARMIDGQDLAPLLTYFQNRDVWVLEADEKPQRIYPYSPSRLVP